MQEFKGGAPDALYDNVQTYLSSKGNKNAKRLLVSLPKGLSDPLFTMADDAACEDRFNGEPQANKNQDLQLLDGRMPLIDCLSLSLSACSILTLLWCHRRAAGHTCRQDGLIMQTICSGPRDSAGHER